MGYNYEKRGSTDEQLLIFMPYMSVRFVVRAVVVCKPVFPPPLLTLLLTPGCHGELCWSLVLRAIVLSAEDWMIFTELQSSHCTSQWCFDQTDNAFHFYTKRHLNVIEYRKTLTLSTTAISQVYYLQSDLSINLYVTTSKISRSCC